MEAQTLPLDVTAYLISSAVRLAKKQGFFPQSEKQTEQWLNMHCRTIGEYAMNGMNSLRDRLLTDDALRNQVVAALTSEVYNAIPKDGDKKWNPRFLRYAQSRGMTPEEVLVADGGTMTNYLCWLGA